MFILGVMSLVFIVGSIMAALFFMTISDGTGNETGLIASMLLMYGALPFFLLGVFLSAIHTLASLV
jgi:hypothetical protein